MFNLLLEEFTFAQRTIKRDVTELLFEHVNVNDGDGDVEECDFCGGENCRD